MNEKEWRFPLDFVLIVTVIVFLLCFFGSAFGAELPGIEIPGYSGEKIKELCHDKAS